MIDEMEKVLDDLKKDQYERTIVPNAYGGYTDSKKTGRGPFKQSENLEFVDVPLATPNGDILIPKMNFKITPGQNVMIVGPNGCGKSSLFRIIGNLWPHFAGTIAMPSYGNIMYVP